MTGDSIILNALSPVLATAPEAPAPATLLVGVGVGALLAVVAFGLLRLLRKPAATLETLELTPATGAGDAPHAPRPTSLDARIAQAITTGFDEWLNSCGDRSELWTAFDQFIREMLCTQLEATRVRCYHIEPSSGALVTVPQSGRGGSEETQARAGVLGHVATAGREYVAGDDTHGELVDDLAARDADDWAWVWPVRIGTSNQGVVAVGNVRDPSILTPAVRKTLGTLVTLCWRQVATLVRLRIAQRTDRGSGVLTRNDFFTVAGDALADSYRANEPVVMAVIALEGLRRLDDAGQWQARDALIERVGKELQHRLRTDDLVGRFADDRFVILLRRLDSGLGKLIAEKLLAGAQAAIGEIESVEDRVRLRVGLVGSGFNPVALETLLEGALERVDYARHAGVDLQSDVCRPDGEEPSS
jgi:GGDEF domain-containing protein